MCLIKCGLEYNAGYRWETWVRLGATDKPLLPCETDLIITNASEPGALCPVLGFSAGSS